ncbi:MAG: hypothetical protein ABSG18_25350 [Steroidobacteraceae bacterium]|jgi:hypothetical protein
MPEQLEWWQALLVERLREWKSAEEVRWLDARLTEVAWRIAYCANERR